MSDDLKSRVLHHLMYSISKDADHAKIYDWRLALSYAIRDRVVEGWVEASREASRAGAKRVYYLSMEFLIGRLLEDAMVNLGSGSKADGRSRSRRTGSISGMSGSSSAPNMPMKSVSVALSQRRAAVRSGSPRKV